MKKIFFILIKPIGFLFFERKWLQGKHFVSDGEGWIWVLKGLWFQKILGFNRRIPFPIAPTVTISSLKNIILGQDNLNNFQSPGVYFQNFSAKIILGDNVFIAPNVGLITANHNFRDLNVHIEGKDIFIGSHSWIGMNAVIMPGVKLGPNTIVGAGSIVTKSFESGNIVIAGNPAKIIKEL